MSSEVTRRGILAMIRVIDKAIMMERNAGRFYRQAADWCPSRQGRAMFTWLSNFESAHEARLLAKRKDLAAHPLLRGQSLPSPEYTDISEATGEGCQIGGEAEVDILKQALKNEKRAYAFYEKKSTVASDPTVAAVFREMAKEEERHIRILTEQLEHVRLTGLWKQLDLQ